MDWTTITVAVIAFFGTLVGSLAGIRESSRTVNFRLDKLEKKVDLHNNAVERLYHVEDLARRNEGRIKELENIHPRE